jgi:hypothetical protein
MNLGIGGDGRDDGEGRREEGEEGGERKEEGI